MTSLTTDSDLDKIRFGKLDFDGALTGVSVSIIVIDDRLRFIR